MVCALGLVIGTNVQPFDANIMKSNAAAVLSAAVTATPEDAGTKASGSYTPSPVGGNFKKYINGGAHTLAAPSFAGNYTLVIQVTNSASAGASVQALGSHTAPSEEHSCSFWRCGIIETPIPPSTASPTPPTSAGSPAW